MEELNVLSQAIEIAQQKGCYSLKDAVIVASALESLKQKLTKEEDDKASS